MSDLYETISSRLFSVHPRRHFQEGPQDEPELLAIGAHAYRVRCSRQNDELAVLLGELLIRVQQIFLGGDAVKFSAHDPSLENPVPCT
jgi:hypothetical protein